MPVSLVPSDGQLSSPTTVVCRGGGLNKVNDQDATNPQLSEIAWLPVHELERCRLYLAVLRYILKDGVAGGRPVYLGDVN